MFTTTNLSTINGKPSASTTYVSFDKIGLPVYAVVRIFYFEKTDQWYVSRVRGWIDYDACTHDWRTASSHLSYREAQEHYTHIKHVWERRIKQERFFPED